MEGYKDKLRRYEIAKVIADHFDNEIPSHIAALAINKYMESELKGVDRYLVIAIAYQIAILQNRYLFKSHFITRAKDFLDLFERLHGCLPLKDKEAL